MKNARFIKSVFHIKDLPRKDLPEVVLCGRSNVGKSSFINTVFNRKNLAKISSSPGKTRSLNYYLIEENFFLVDLPGYGYATVSKSEKDKWQKLVDDYFRKRESISLAIHFIDSRHPPAELDLVLNEYLVANEIPFIILLSKIDKLKQSEIAVAKENVKVLIRKDFENEVFLFSSKSGRGKADIIKKMNLIAQK